MTAKSPAAGEAPSRTRTYLMVLLVEAVVVAALWTLGHYFGSQ